MNEAEVIDTLVALMEKTSVRARLDPDSGIPSAEARIEEKRLRKLVVYDPYPNEATRLHALLELQSVERKLASFPGAGASVRADGMRLLNEKRREQVEEWFFEHDTPATYPGTTPAEWLKTRREAIGKGNLGLRWERSLSWFQRAEKEFRPSNSGAAFIFFWIAFNALYSEDIPEGGEHRELESISKYFAKLTALDTHKSVERAIFDNHRSRIEEFLNNEKAGKPLTVRETGPVLEELFGRLYYIRNRLIHGGIPCNAAGNRSQAELMRFLLPVFLELMFDNPGVDWGAPKYPAEAGGV